MDIYKKEYEVDKQIEQLRKLKELNQPVCGTLYYLLRKFQKEGKKVVTIFEILAAAGLDQEEVDTFYNIIMKGQQITAPDMVTLCKIFKILGEV